MQRRFDKLQSQFDVLVIGGGITGAWCAYDAARRGLKVAMVEKTDWASGTSSASSKMIHGGLRYLEQLEIGLVRHSLAERKRLSNLAPHQVGSVRFLIPVFDDDRVGRARYQMGMVMYDGLSGRRQPVDKHERLSAKTIKQDYPHLRQKGLVGGFTYGDCQEDDARFTLEIVYGAIRNGAVCVNHARVMELLKDENGAVAGALVEDELTGDAVSIDAKVVINAAGPWSQELLGDSEANLIRKVKGVHLVMPSLNHSDGMFITSRSDGRALFIIPWYGQTLLGTTDTDYDNRADSLAVNDDEIDYLLNAANDNFEEICWTHDDVLGAFAGLRTLQAQEGKNATAASRDWSLEEPLPNLLMPIGGKYTTARDDAAKIVNKAIEVGKFEAKPCTTDVRPTPWCPLGDFDSWSAQTQEKLRKAGMDDLTALYTSRRHGRKVDNILRLIEAQPDLAARVQPSAPFCWAEVVNAAQREMAQSLEDILRRRAPIALFGPLSDAQLDRAAKMAGAQLGWDADERQRQIEHFRSRLTHKR